MSASSKPHIQKPNHLIAEKSPYLQQHAYNPVEWYPWGDEALNLSKKTNKPIFLSIGYSTCHWCHVMAHESFENEEIAAVLNQHFINIKVDREERPDLDAVYMTATQLLTGGGGWPMSVWLTPDLKPFYAGTYFPLVDSYGHPGFKTILTKLAELYENQRDRINPSIDQLMTAMEHALGTGALKETGPIPDVNAMMEDSYQSLKAIFDLHEGGFGPPPKFPMPVYYDFLLTYYSRTKNKHALEMTEITLMKMLQGGIFDQLGGGFSRYSTDARWIVPHFEKMLYDNGQLIGALAGLYQINKSPAVKEGLEKSVSYILRDMTHPEGGFYSAEDADSEGKEGTFYLWTIDEVKKVLGDELADIFIERYGLTIKGNFHDLHHPDPGRNILVISKSLEEVAKKFGKEPGETKQLLGAAENRIFDIRSKRIRPHLDDKILTEWNGLMISGLTKAGLVLDDPTIIEAALRAAKFIENNLWDKKNKILYRRWRAGERKVEALQIDYALFIQGLLDLFEATGEADLITWAIELHEVHEKLFTDSKSGGYFSSVPKNDLLFRVKDDRDNVIPSGNSVAVYNGYRLGGFTNNKKWIASSDSAIASFSKNIENQPLSLAYMLKAFDYQVNGHLQVVLVGNRADSKFKKLVNVVHNQFIPNKLVILVDPKKNQSQLGALNPLLQNMTAIDEGPTAYVCVNFSCQKPTTDENELLQQLKDAQGLNK